MTTIEGLEAFRAKAAVHDRAGSLDQFRDDFDLVYRAERLHGHANEDEAAQQRRQAGLIVKERMADAGGMANAAVHFSEMADTIRRDIARSERIRAEMQAERRKTA